MILLYLRLPDFPSTVPAPKKAENAEGKDPSHGWERWFRFPGKTSKASQPQRELRKTHSTYYLERRFFL